MAELKVADVMTRDPFCIQKDQEVFRADRLMRSKSIRHVPVLDGKTLIGTITERSLSEFFLNQDYEVLIENDATDLEFRLTDRMARELRFDAVLEPASWQIFEFEPLDKAVMLMMEKKTDYLICINQAQEVVGILTTIDLLSYIHKILSSQQS